MYAFYKIFKKKIRSDFWKRLKEGRKNNLNKNTFRISRVYYKYYTRNNIKNFFARRTRNCNNKNTASNRYNIQIWRKFDRVIF